MENVITFSGSNEKLFSRSPVASLNIRQTIIVPETHNAILVKDGQMLQTLSSGKYKLDTFVDPKEDAGSTLEILFMSKTAKLKLLWGTAQRFTLYDFVLDEDYHVGMSGDFEGQIGDPRKCYLYLVGVAEDLTADSLQERLQSNVVSVLEDVVMQYAETNKVCFNQLSLTKKNVSAKVLSGLNQKLMNEYGIAVFSFNIANIIIDEEDHKRLSAHFKELKNPGKTEQVEEPKQVKSGLFCKECGQPLEEDAKFCPNCGKKVSSKKICSNCNAENPDGAKFCSSCGNKL
ncbi:MAG: zinc-ribbon domain-containing protein [Clostridia bacterium]|nr:zinc-ribbon domain-containing protein [Clostridia bacterium]